MTYDTYAIRHKAYACSTVQRAQAPAARGAAGHEGGREAEAPAPAPPRGSLTAYCRVPSAEVMTAFEFEQTKPDYLLWGAASARVLLVRVHLMGAL
jgi:hypothetical protein